MDSETHYLTYDPEKIFDEMQFAFINAGGDVLYPGDEKEMLLRAVQAIFVQGFAGVDHALRMATLRYAVGDYLDLYGEKRGCYRIDAAAATAEVEIKFAESAQAKTIPAGTAVTADGERLYLLTEDVEQTGFASSVQTTVIAAETGSGGNGLLAGQEMQFLVAQSAVTKIICTKDASGGGAREDDDTYRERIRTFGLANITTGPQLQYEAAAKAVSSEILDARAVNGGAGRVNVALLLAGDTGSSAIIAAVAAALNGVSTRPLTDEVTVRLATGIPYTLKVRYKTETGQNVSAAIAEAVAAYQKWQDKVIGRAFNPDRLMASIYQAGATRVLWGMGSEFNGGTVEYTEIAETAHCKGTITIEVME